MTFSLRSTAAGLLVVLLVCGAVWAGVCPLQCELRRDTAASRHRASDEGMSMPMGHCHDAMTAARDTVSTGCAGMPCGPVEIAAVVRDEVDRALSMDAPRLVVVVSVEGHVLPPVRIVRFVSEGPPSAGVGFDPLIVALRV